MRTVQREARVTLSLKRSQTVSLLFKETGQKTHLHFSNVSKLSLLGSVGKVSSLTEEGGQEEGKSAGAQGKEQGWIALEEQRNESGLWRESRKLRHDTFMRNGE